MAKMVSIKAIISLFADSGLKLAELANIKVYNIDWDNHLIKVPVKYPHEPQSISKRAGYSHLPLVSQKGSKQERVRRHLIRAI